MFNHHAFRDRVALSGVNSINWARIVAQTVYYFTAAVALGAPARSIDFTVPTGNFGDIFAGYVAKRMGLPIGRLRVATNVNDILARTLASGAYEVRGVQPTSSPSMDIQVSSNFERLVFEAGGRDAAMVRGLMASLGQSGRFELPAAALRAIRADFDAGSASEAETAAAIRAHIAGSRRVDRSAHRRGACGGRERNGQSAGADGDAFDRASGQVPGCCGSRLRRAAGAAVVAGRPDDAARAHQCDACAATRG